MPYSHVIESHDDLKEIPGQDRPVEAQGSVSISTTTDTICLLRPPGPESCRWCAGRPGSEPGEGPSEWCYVYNFEDYRKPHALELPPGRGMEPAHDMERMIEGWHHLAERTNGDLTCFTRYHRGKPVIGSFRDTG